MWNRRYRSLFWPAILILVGVFALLVNVRLVPVERLDRLVDLWPLILVVIGLGVVVRGAWAFDSDGDPDSRCRRQDWAPRSCGGPGRRGLSDRHHARKRLHWRRPFSRACRVLGAQAGCEPGLLER